VTVRLVHASLSERLRDAEAAFRLEPGRGSTALVAVAVDMLVAGVSTPGITGLAGDDAAPSEDVERDFGAVLRELGLTALTPADSALRMAREIAHALGAGTVAPRDAATRLWTLFVAADYPDELAEFANIADGFGCIPEHVTKVDLRAAAADYVGRAGRVATG